MPEPTRRRAIASLIVLSSLSPYALAQGAPTAVVTDSAEGGGRAGGLFFFLAAANGVTIEETALSSSRNASFMRGNNMLIRTASRPVPSGAVSLTLRAIQTHAAPIETMFRTLFKDGDPEVMGTVDVTLAPGQRYRVNGFMDSFRREVWLEDSNGTLVPGSKVTGQPNTALLQQMQGAVFTRTNLRYDEDWINESSAPHLPFVPLGSRIKVMDWGKNRAAVLIDGRKMRIGIDYTRGLETVEQFFARISSPEDPRVQLDGIPVQVRNAIRSARVVPGMTREQVLLALGRPRLDFVPDLEATEWKYEVPADEEIYLVFEGKLLKTVDASRKGRGYVLQDTA
jgi:hypothetical protein